MRRCFIGLEFTHDKLQPRAIVRVKTRFGPIKRWVDEKKPEVIGGLLRERVALLMPFGFRFRKDEIYNHVRGREDYRKWADGKFYVAMTHAEGKYTPHAPKPAIKKLDAPQAGVGVNKTEAVDNPEVSHDEGVLVPGDETTPKTVESGPTDAAKNDEGSVQAGRRPTTDPAVND